MRDFPARRCRPQWPPRTRRRGSRTKAHSKKRAEGNDLWRVRAVFLRLPPTNQASQASQASASQRRGMRKWPSLASSSPPLPPLTALHFVPLPLQPARVPHAPDDDRNDRVWIGPCARFRLRPLEVALRDNEIGTSPARRSSPSGTSWEAVSFCPEEMKEAEL